MSRIFHQIPKTPALPIQLKKPRVNYLGRPQIQEVDYGTFWENIPSNLGATQGFPADRMWRWLINNATTLGQNQNNPYASEQYPQY